MVENLVVIKLRWIGLSSYYNMQIVESKHILRSVVSHISTPPFNLRYTIMESQ